jgi:pSer/pThr/pTyr-binding forkhead associated (FHA) protein
MAAAITLTATEGRFKGKEYRFDGRLMCVVGRAEDCYLRLPSEPAFLDVSRRHCLLDIDPPDVRVSDLGSRNGTYVNGVKIGQRPSGTLPTDALAVGGPEVVVHDRDEIRVGGNTFRVGVVYPVVPAGGKEPATACLAGL